MATTAGVAKLSDDTATNEPTPEISARKIPAPSGYHILLAILKPSKMTEGGILKADVTVEIEQTSSVIGHVVAMGPDCYQNKERFPHEPWCKVGDFALVGAYRGTRFVVEDAGIAQEFRIINDDTVLAVVDDPRGYRRV